MSKYLVVGIIIIILGIAVFYFIKPAEPPQSPAPQNEKTEETVTKTKSQEENVPSLEETTQEKQPKTTQEIQSKNIVNYTTAGFFPATLTIEKGSSVTFHNDSQESLWVASAFHPTHTVYPTTGGCLGSTFDSCKNISGGESWSFQFDITGEWKYHNHLNPGKFGTIIVK